MTTTIPYQGTGSSLSNTNFNQILDAMQSGLNNISSSGALFNNADVVQARTFTFNGLIDRGNLSGTQTINFASGLVQGCTLVSGATISWASPSTGSMWRGTLFVLQDSTGSRLVTWSKTEWTNGGSALGMSGGRMDVVTVMPSYRAGSYVASTSVVY